MTAPENFLTRWSRRKLDAKESAAPATAEAAPQKPAADSEAVEKRSPTDDGTPDPVPAFDLASLPSLDSIGAETDISVFLKAGVPGDLKLAALRRAWVTDPAIRDFKGLAENDWDFTIPNETMGFAEIDPGLDVKKMLANVFGDTPGEKPAADQAVPAGDPLAEPGEEIGVTADRVDSASEEDIVHRTSGAAPHADDEDEQDPLLPMPRRRQGGALPQ